MLGSSDPLVLLISFDSSLCCEIAAIFLVRFVQIIDLLNAKTYTLGKGEFSRIFPDLLIWGISAKLDFIGIKVLLITETEQALLNLLGDIFIFFSDCLIYQRNVRLAT